MRLSPADTNLEPPLLQAKPGVKLHVLGETVDGHDLDVLQVRSGGAYYAQHTLTLCRVLPVYW